MSQPAIRLLTLTGPGGVGKTRLALRVAEAVTSDFPDGVWFVPLASVRDAAHIPSAIGQALDVRESGDRSHAEGIAAFLRHQQSMLILDNFEHVLAAAPLVSELLVACPQLTCLATSRAVLRVSGEHAFPVPPLPLPPTSHGTTAERARLSPAVRLFVARGRAARPDFDLSDATAADVERICRRLDGLPLAIELAAARVRHFSPAELTARLEERDLGATLRVLTGGPRDAPDRQRTLRQTIVWSHDLLEPGERALLRRLAPFVGGFTRQAAEAVANAGGHVGIDIAEGIASLVDQSLLQREDGPDGETRYTMLETIREFGFEQLTAAVREEAATREAHAAYYLTLAERAAPELHAHHQVTWLARLTLEHSNLRAALGWLKHMGDGARLARLAWALFWFWWFRGHLAEANGWYEQILSGGNDLPPIHRGTALSGAAQLAWTLRDPDRAEALSLETLASTRALEPPFPAGLAHLMLNGVASMRGDFTAATTHGEAALTELRRVETWQGAVWLRIALNDIGLHAVHAGDGERGLALLEEALTLVEGTGDRYLAGVHWSDLGLAAQVAGDETRAARCYIEGLLQLQAVGGEWYLATPLAGLAAAVAPRDPVWAAQLLGAAEELRARSGQPNWPIERDRDERAVAVLRAVLGETQLTEERGRGKAMPLPDVLARATALNTRDATSNAGASTPAGGLSPREREVLRLLVAGQSDREIAETLFISPRTASKHVGAILAKLDVASRGEAAVVAVRRGLV